MLASVHIGNYPPFKDLTIPDSALPRGVGPLGRINLITGYNSVGKTSLLRAIHLLAGALSVESEGTTGLVTEIGGQRVNLSCRVAQPARVLDTEAPEHRSSRYTAGVSRERPSATPLPVVYVFPDQNDEPENARRLARLDDDDWADLLEVLRTFEPGLRAMKVMPPDKPEAILCDVDGPPHPVPLGLMGAGLVQTVRLLLAVMTARNGLVLADEIGNSLHHRQLEAVWRFLCEHARRDDVQVFATTHSDECIRAAQLAHTANLTDTPGTLRQALLLHRIYELSQPRTGHICTTYDPESLHFAVRHGTELR